MISVSSAEIDLYCEKIEEVIAMLDSIDYSIDPYDPCQNIEKTPHHCVGYSKASLKMLHDVIQLTKKDDKD